MLGELDLLAAEVCGRWWVGGLGELIQQMLARGLAARKQERSERKIRGHDHPRPRPYSFQLRTRKGDVRNAIVTSAHL